MTQVSHCFVIRKIIIEYLQGTMLRVQRGLNKARMALIWKGPTGSGMHLTMRRWQIRGCIRERPAREGFQERAKPALE